MPPSSPSRRRPGRRDGRHRNVRPRDDSRRAASPVVGLVAIVALTVLLAALGVAAAGFGESLREPTPRATFEGELSATDGWPDGQRLRLVHNGGDRLRVADLAVAVELPQADVSARVVDLPTRRLDAEHVRGRDVFDGTYAGVDGALDAAHTDGRWGAGESTSLRVAQAEIDVRPGDRALIHVVHRPTNGVVDSVVVRAE